MLAWKKKNKVGKVRVEPKTIGVSSSHNQFFLGFG